jgi:light-harvesting complex 1 beta chain
MADSMTKREGSLTGLTDDEAKEFHKLWTSSAVFYVGVAVVAHILVWAWRPWLGPSMPHSRADLIDAVNTTISFLV